MEGWKEAQSSVQYAQEDAALARRRLTVSATPRSRPPSEKIRCHASWITCSIPWRRESLAVVMTTPFALNGKRFSEGSLSQRFSTDCHMLREALRIGWFQ
ncbi:hypothetical protein Q1695_006217 [Nippostrongylus brasiliensis]|nr:hypothetical protein Q1695_006217 [Nippostrongylus brasiliensis]